MELNMVQVIVTALLSSGFVGGLMTLLQKMIPSPESKNDLARLGNEFAHQLLIDAKTEREELRLTIRELEDLITEKRDTVDRLKQLAKDKDDTIRDLEERLIKMAEKLESGQRITLRDIFGEKAPEGFLITKEEVV